MTTCARQVMNRIPGDVTPPWARCWGPLHPCSMSRARYLPAQRNRQPARLTPPDRGPIAPRQATLGPVWHLPAIWNHLHIEDSCSFQWRDVDAVTPEFPLDLQNTSPEYFRYWQVMLKIHKNATYLCPGKIPPHAIKCHAMPCQNFYKAHIELTLSPNWHVMLQHTIFETFVVKWQKSVSEKPKMV